MSLEPSSTARMRSRRKQTPSHGGLTRPAKARSKLSVAPGACAGCPRRNGSRPGPWNPVYGTGDRTPTRGGSGRGAGRSANEHRI